LRIHVTNVGSMMSLTITLLAAVRASEIGPSACYGVFARSFRERKLEFLSTQTVETHRFCSFAGKLPLFCLRKNTKTNEGIFGPCPRAHFHGSTTRGHCKAHAPTTVGPADQGARLPLASKRRYLRGRVKGHRGGGRKVPRGSPDAPNCGQVAPTAVRRRCAEGPRWARPGARRRRAPGLVGNYRETKRAKKRWFCGKKQKNKKKPVLNHTAPLLNIVSPARSQTEPAHLNQHGPIQS
jgi:hypothetical protein